MTHFLHREHSSFIKGPEKKICLLQVTVCITAASQTQVKNGSQDELSRSFETLFFKSSSISNFFRAFGASKDSNWIHFLPLGLGELELSAAYGP